MDRIIDKNTGQIILPPERGIPMGPDTDLLFVLQKNENGYINLGNVGPEDSHLKPLADALRNPVQVAPGKFEFPSTIQHGAALGHDGKVTGWGSALIMTIEGRLFWIEEPYVRSWFNFRGVPFPEGKK